MRSLKNVSHISPGLCTRVFSQHPCAFETMTMAALPSWRTALVRDETCCARTGSTVAQKSWPPTGRRTATPWNRRPAAWITTGASSCGDHHSRETAKFWPLSARAYWSRWVSSNVRTSVTSHGRAAGYRCPFTYLLLYGSPSTWTGESRPSDDPKKSCSSFHSHQQV